MTSCSGQLIPQGNILLSDIPYPFVQMYIVCSFLLIKFIWVQNISFEKTGKVSMRVKNDVAYRIMAGKRDDTD